MKEIGGYFELEKVKGVGYYPNVPAFDCARSSFRKWCEAENVREIYLPYYNCDVVAKCCADVGIKIHFYHIDERLFPEIEDNREVFVYIVNYYGVFDKKTVAKLAQRFHNRIIVDNAHAFFEGPYESIPSFNTCRKFFGVADGSYLFCDKEISRDEPRLCVARRLTHLVGRGEEAASCFYEDFQVAEDLFLSEKQAYGISEFSENILRGIDYTAVIKKRIENFHYLESRLASQNSFKHKVTSVPFAYPFMTKDADMLRSFLIENKVYVAKYWKSARGTLFNETETRMVNNVLPLPIDQRYGKEDMERICTLIQQAR